MDAINIWSIVVASVVAFAIGAIWYSPILFGKEWMALNKMTDKDISDTQMKGVAWFYVIQFIITLVSFCVLGFAVNAFGTYTASDGAFLGLLAWVGFVLPIGVSALMWEKKPFKLILINMICTLLTLVVGGAIIGAW
ncbi:MAG: hypothetical protein RL536_162 [Candidatus Parcubacteria bacterium]|jgi:hypothetical protein